MVLRLVVTTLLLGITIFFQLRETGEFLVHPAIPLYVLIGAIFLLSIIYAVSLPLLPDLWLFSVVQVVFDVIYATVLIHFTGGASSAFTLLYIFPIITSGLLHFRKGALLTAAGASVMFGLVINLEFYGVISAAEWPWVSPWSRHTPGYLLWILVVHFTFFFILAILSSAVSEQLQRTKLSLNVTQSHFKNLSELHQSIVKSIPSGIITTDERDHVQYINTSGRAMLGLGLDELVDSALTKIFPVIRDNWMKTWARKEKLLTTRRVLGEMKHFEISVSDLRGKDELPKGRLVVFQDVTDLRKMEERVKLSENQASLVRIAAGMAHEIRNPLASLRGATELLTQSAGQSLVDARLLGIILRESDRLNGLLGDFLLTVGAHHRHVVRIMLDELVEETVILFAKEPRVMQGASVETLLAKGVEIEGDPARLKQALWNLLLNALEAGDENGAIRVLLDKEEDMAALRIQDSGHGVPPEIQDRIFEPFTTTKERGTGLGLSLVLSIAQSHGGSLELENSSTAGTVFCLRLPRPLAGRGHTTTS